jgi:tripartite-type tricarboxylate transporter receptor subunit TctC
MTRLFAWLFVLLIGVTAPVAAGAQAFPSRPIRIVIGFGPGGLADVTMRIVAQKLTDLTGQQVIVDNKPGAGGVLAANTVTSARPDGYTLLVMTNGTAISRALFKSLAFDPVADFRPISTVAYFDVLVLANGTSPMRTLSDVLATAKAKGGGFNIGTINPGSTQNLTGQLFKAKAGIDAAVVAFRTTPDVLTALVRGDIDIGFETYTALKAAIDAGQIRALAGTGEARSPVLPSVPTAKEAGLADFVVVGWNALVAPAQTPPEMIEILHRHIKTVVEMPDVRQRFLEMGSEAGSSTPQQLGDRLKADIAKWNAVIDQAGIERQ